MRAIGVEHDCFDLIVLGCLIECVIQLIEHGFVLRVPNVNTIQGNPRNMLVYRVNNG